MKKYILFLSCFLAVVAIILCALILVPFTPTYEKGPKAQYRVEEGLIDVFSLKDGQVGSLLSCVKPGETFTARTISAAALKVPIWLEWMEPLAAEAVGRANLFMYKESKKARYRKFAVGYTDESIERGFTREIEKAKGLSNVRMNFYPDGFSLSGQVGGVLSLSVRGYASTEGMNDRLFLHLRWIKIGDLFLPERVLRALENIFSKAYVESSHPSIKLLRITFSDKKMIMFFQKEGENNANVSSQSETPEVFFPYGD